MLARRALKLSIIIIIQPELTLRASSLLSPLANFPAVKHITSKLIKCWLKS